MNKICVFFLIICAYGLGHSQDIGYSWAKGFEGSGSESINCKSTLDNKGNVITAINFSGNLDADPGPLLLPLVTSGSGDIAVCKLDSTGNLVWAKQFGGISGDLAHSVRTDQEGNIYLTGYFNGTALFDSYSIATNGGSDIFLCKMDEQGNVIWVKSIGGLQGDIGTAIELDTAGNVFLNGSFRDVVDFDPGPGLVELFSISGNTNFVCKFDSAGLLIWAQKTLMLDYQSAMAVDGDGNVYIGSTFSGTQNVGSFVLIGGAAPNGDMFVVKIDFLGGISWAKSIAGPTVGIIYSLSLDKLGGLYFTGVNNTSADFDPGPGSAIVIAGPAGDPFICKWDTAGNYIWAKGIVGGGGDIGYSIFADSIGNTFTTGYFGGVTDFDPGPETVSITPIGPPDIFLTQFDSSGNFVWVKTIGDSGWDLGFSVTQDKITKWIYLSGSFQQTVDFDPDAGVSTITSLGPTDAFLAKFYPLQEIEIKVASLLIPNNSSYDFGGISIGQDGIMNFTVDNISSVLTSLSISGAPNKVQLSGTDASDFTIDETALAASILGGSSSSFSITFTPSSLGIKNATIIIPNNDPDENPYIINLQGTGTKLSQTISNHITISKTYGDASFLLTATASSGLPITLVSSDPSVVSLSGSTVNILGAGGSNITASQSGDASYLAAPDTTITITIDKAPLTFTVDNQSKTYGDVDPVFTYSYSGFVNGEDATVIDLVPMVNAGNMDAGTQSIVASGGSDDNYDFLYVDGIYSIAKAPITITADNKSRGIGEANPLFTFSYAGFVNTETATVLDLLPNAFCSAIPTSTPGVYPIVLSGGNDNNYIYTLVDGSLTVNSGIGTNIDVLPEDTGFCKGESVQLDALLDNVSYRWYYDETQISTSKQPTVNQSGEYVLEVEDGFGNVGRDTVFITENPQALTSSFLLPSESGIEDTAVAVDISFAKPDSVFWDWGGASAIKKADDTWFLTFPTTGTYTITLTSHLGFCTKVSQNVIVVSPGSLGQGGTALYPDIIREVTASPNPTDGNVLLKTTLGREENITIYLYDAFGNQLETITSAAASYLHQNTIDMSGRAAGQYTIRVLCGTDQRIVRVVKL